MARRARERRTGVPAARGAGLLRRTKYETPDAWRNNAAVCRQAYSVARTANDSYDAALGNSRVRASGPAREMRTHDVSTTFPSPPFLSETLMHESPAPHADRY